MMPFAHQWIAHVLAQTAGDPPVVNPAQVQSIWDFIVKGGPMMIPIGACSLVALTVVIERLISLRRGNIIPPTFLPGLKTILKDGLEDRESALSYCRQNPSPVASVFAVGIKRLGEPIELFEKRIQEAGERAVLKLRKFLRLLAVIASVCPLMGLLGTIFGMIDAFQTVAVSGEALGKTELLAKGIYAAMITTAAGLLVAIPVLMCYHWIAAKIDSLVSDIDQSTIDFIEEYVYQDPQTPALQLQTIEPEAETAGSGAVSAS